MYGKLQVLLTLLVSKEFMVWLINALTSSSVLQNRFVNFLLNKAHIFSAGFNSGLCGGINSSAILSGISKAFALWNAPLSNISILNSSGFCLASSFKNNWKWWVLHAGISKRKLSPFSGENAPKSQSVWNTWWNGQIGLMPFAVSAFPFRVNRPNLLELRSQSSNKAMLYLKIVLKIKVDWLVFAICSQYYFLAFLTKVFLKASTADRSFLTWLLRATFILLPKCRLVYFTNVI